MATGDQGKWLCTISALREVGGKIPKSRIELRKLIATMAAELEPQKWPADVIPSNLLTLLESILIVAEQSTERGAGKTSEKSIRLACSELVSTLDDLRNRAESHSTAVGNENPPLSLHDVAALLVMFDPGVRGEVEQTRQVVNGLVYSGNYCGFTKQLLGQALVRLDNLIAGTVADPIEVWAEVGRLVEAAINASELVTERRDQNADSADNCIRSLEGTVSAAAKPLSGHVVDACLPFDADTELLREFITESLEFIEGAEAALLALESSPENGEAINTVFRAFHTIKGTSAYLGLVHLSELSHLAESLLSRVRDREILCTGSHADLALRSIDMLRLLLKEVQNALPGQFLAKPATYDELLELLETTDRAIESGCFTQSTPTRIGDILVAQGSAKREKIEEIAAAQGNELLGVALVKQNIVSSSDVARALQTQRKTVTQDHASESSVRVRTDQLDRLIDMVGELVIAHSMVSQDETMLQSRHHEMGRKVTHAGKIVRELQDLSMSLRMVPLKATFQKMTRLVRDVAQKQGKAITLVTEDRDTEIDRNMVDAINDMLVHMIRNAVDHGIEAQHEREQKGKSRTGTIRMVSYHSGGKVVVEISDDGRGLDRDKIIAKAVARKLIESGKGLSDSEVYNLIFEPGFSTVDQVTDVSGRGVGMDVVRRQVESLRGRIEITSESGKGTTFTIRLPLTLAITDGMLVRVGTERYIIPTVNIHLSFRPTVDVLSTIAGKGEIVMLRGEPLPIFRLHRLFGIESAIQDVTKGLLVVVDDGERRCALLVDMLLGKQQVVAKSLGAGISRCPGITGGAILGDGRVGLILDTSELVAQARMNLRSDVTRPAA